MSSKFLIILSLFVAVSPVMCSAVEHIDFDVDIEYEEYQTDGTPFNIRATVTNPSPNWNVADVSVTLTGGFEYDVSPASATITAGGSADFTITVTSFIWKRQTVKVIADAADTDDYTVDGGSGNTRLLPPFLAVEVLGPENEMRIVVENLSEERGVDFTALVKNIGTADLEGVVVDLSYDEDKLNCGGGGESGIERNAIAEYGVGCEHVNSGDQVILRIEDSNGAIKENHGVRFKFVLSLEDTPSDVIIDTDSDLVPEDGGVSFVPNTTIPMFRGNYQRDGVVDGTGDLRSDYLVSWRYDLPNGVFGTPAVGDLVGDEKLEIVVPLDKTDGLLSNSIVVLNSDGKLVWGFKTDSAVHSSPCISDVNKDGSLDVIFGTNGGQVYALEGATGKVLWKADKEVGAFRSSPVAFDLDGDGNVEIYIGSDKGLYAIDGESGMNEWIYPTSSEILSSPSLGNLDGDEDIEIAFASRDGIFYALDWNGELSWYVNLNSRVSYSSPLIRNGAAIIGTESAGLSVIRNGGIIASFDYDAAIGASPAFWSNRSAAVFATLSDDNPYAPSEDSKNKAYWVSLDGSSKWEKGTRGRGVFTSPTIADIDRDGKDEALFGSEDGRVYAIELETANEDWSYLGGTGLYASPVLADIDADGDLEVIVAYLYSNQIKVLDSPDKAELVVESINLSSDFPADRENLTIWFVVKNVGDIASPVGNVGVYRKSPISRGLIGVVSFGALEAGESVMLNYTWETRLPKGEVGVLISVDVNKTINESDETNNWLYKGFDNDLSIAEASFPTEVVGSLEEMGGNVAVKIFNKGRVNISGVEVALKVEGGPKDGEIVVKSVDIAANENGSVDLTFNYAPSEERQTLIVTLDPNGKISEVYENNNVAEWVVEPVEEEVPSLTSGKISPIGGANPIIIIILVGVIGIILWKKLISPKARRKREKKKFKKTKGDKKGGGQKPEGAAPPAPAQQDAIAAPERQYKEAMPGSLDSGLY